MVWSVGLEHPERADEAAAVLRTQLEDWRGQDRSLNASLVYGLVELRDTQAAPLMEAAFAAGAVELDVNGDWEDVQVDLGLLTERTTPPPAFRAMRPGARQASHRAAARARQRRKAEKKARKRNRRK